MRRVWCACGLRRAPACSVCVCGCVVGLSRVWGCALFDSTAGCWQGNGVFPVLKGGGGMFRVLIGGQDGITLNGPDLVCLLNRHGYALASQGAGGLRFETGRPGVRLGGEDDPVIVASLIGF